MPLSPTDARFRPLLSAWPRLTDGGAEMEVGNRVVGVEGDPLEVARMLLLCDGSRTLEQLAAAGPLELSDLRALVDELFREGAVVDCAEGWRVLQAASSSVSPLLRPPSDEDIAVAGSRGLADSGPLIPLASPATDLDAALAARRSSTASDPPRPVTFEELSGVLSRMYGDGSGGRRPVPSGGALYPLVLHVALAGALGPAEAGTWRYDPSAGGLRAARREAADRATIFTRAPDARAHLERGQPVVLISAEISRAARKYGPRAYRLALLEAGAAMQNAYLAGASLAVPIRAMLGIDEAGAAQALELPDGTVPLLAIFVGI